MSSYTLGHRTVYYVGGPESSSLASITSTTGAPVRYSDIIANYGPGNLFTDPDFPINNSSVGTIGLDTANQANVYPDWDRSFSWFRASDAVTKAFAASNNVTSVQYASTTPSATYSRLDVDQGSLGDCWFLACVSSISVDTDLIQFVAPEDNAANNGSGAYHFRIFHLGIWIDIVVDDYLCCAEFFGPGNGWSIVCAQPPITDGVAELWPVLLEKAYAKLNGSYGNVESNIPLVGLEDLTGGVGERINFGTTPDPNLFAQLQEIVPLRSFMDFSSIAPKGNLQKADFDAVGLHYPHAYSCNKLAVVNYNGVQTQLVRARNPWGRSEWNGAWSDSSPEWNSIDAATKQQLGLVVADDGEFWMPFADAVKYFTAIDICYWVSEDDYAKDTSVLNIQRFNGSWSVANNTAGGYQNPSANPQYPVTIVGSSTESGQGVLVVGVHVKAGINVESVAPYMILLYKVSDTTQYQAPYGDNFFSDPNNTVVQPGGDTVFEGDQYYVLNQDPRITSGFRLDAGTYVIVLSTQSAGTEAQFVISIAAQKAPALLGTTDTSGDTTTLASLVLEA